MSFKCSEFHINLLRQPFMALIMMPYSKISCFSGTLLVIKRKKEEQSKERRMGKNSALNAQGQARCLSILPTSPLIIHLQHSPVQGVFLAEDGRRAQSRQVKLLCGQSSWQLPVNPVGFVFFLELPCSETLIYMWSVVSSWHMPDFKPVVTCHCMKTPAEGPAGQ